MCPKHLNTSLVSMPWHRSSSLLQLWDGAQQSCQGELLPRQVWTAALTAPLNGSDGSEIDFSIFFLSLSHFSVLWWKINWTFARSTLLSTTRNDHSSRTAAELQLTELHTFWSCIHSLAATRASAKEKDLQRSPDRAAVALVSRWR